MLEALREEVFQANLDLVAHGLVTLTWGNASGLSADGDVLVIKPSGVDYKKLRPEHLVPVSMASGKVLSGTLKPSSDTPTHRKLYQAFADAGVRGVAHTHSRWATSFAQARREIPCWGTTHADHFYGTVPLTRPLTADEIEVAYEANTGDVIIERFAGLDPLAMPAVLVASHAPFAWGTTVSAAVQNAVALEAVAEMGIATLALHPAAPPVEQYLMDKHYFRKHGKTAYYGQGEPH